MDPLLSEERVRFMAHAMWRARRRPGGDDWADWLSAERTRAQSIREAAYDRWEARGRPIGSPLVDWLPARLAYDYRAPEAFAAVTAAIRGEDFPPNLPATTGVSTSTGTDALGRRTEAAARSHADGSTSRKVVTYGPGGSVVESRSQYRSPTRSWSVIVIVTMNPDGSLHHEIQTWGFVSPSGRLIPFEVCTFDVRFGDEAIENYTCDVPGMGPDSENGGRGTLPDGVGGGGSGGSGGGGSWDVGGWGGWGDAYARGGGGDGGTPHLTVVDLG